MSRSIERQTPHRAEPLIASAPRRATISLTAFALALGMTVPASIAAMAPDELDVDGAVLMTGAELDSNRGGFSLGPFFVNLGIQITTTVNNAVTVQTVLSFDPTTLAASITASASAAANSAANAGAAAAAAAATAASAAATAASNAASAVVLGTTLPQVVVASVAGDANQVQQSGTGGATDSIPIPVAAAVISEIQDSVAQSGVGDYLPSQTAPAIESSTPVETPQQLADLVLSGVPTQADVQAYGAALAESVVPSSGQIADEIVSALPAIDAQAATPTGTGDASVLSASDMQAASAAGTVDPGVTVTQLTNGALFDVDGTIIMHQILNGVLASIQNSANDTNISQTVQMTVDIQNFESTIGAGAVNMQAASLGDEIARFSSTIGN